MKLGRLTAIPLRVTFAEMYGGEENVPEQVRVPAAHFMRIPRAGQFSTIVVAESDDGCVGYGECFGLPYPLGASSLIEQVIAPALKGVAVDDPAAAANDLRRYFYSMGHTRGAAMEALSGVDIALWDMKARAAGKPLAGILGGAPGPVDVYVSPVPFRRTPEETAADARAYLDAGFTGIKLKIGRGIATDLSHIAAAREAVGASVPLYLDVNCGYDVETSIELAKSLTPYDIGWLEEPIVPDDPAALARVRRASPVPIAAGENDFAIHSFEALVAADAVDFLQPNIGRCGGVSGMVAIGELCERSGLKLAPHGVGGCIAVSAALHACRVAGGFHAYEANRLLNPLRDHMGVHPVALENGALIAPDRPGHGGEPDMAVVEQYRMRMAA